MSTKSAQIDAIRKLSLQIYIAKTQDMRNSGKSLPALEFEQNIDNIRAER